MDSTTRRFGPIANRPTGHTSLYDGQAPVSSHRTVSSSGPIRLRSLSMSMPWRSRPRSVCMHDLTAVRDNGLAESKSHTLEAIPADLSASAEPCRDEKQHHLRDIFRRASLSVRSGMKGFVHRRKSLPATRLLEYDRQTLPQNHRIGWPSYRYSTWSRLRQATSFSRPSRRFHHAVMHGDDFPDPMSPVLPVPGSGEQPPIIPRNTGGAARQAAANAQMEMHGYGTGYGTGNGAGNGPGYDPGYGPGYGTVLPAMPPLTWLQAEDGLSDHESGIGIALTSVDLGPSVPSDETDSVVDVAMEVADSDTAGISKVDFISRLPPELAIQVLALLDATVLSKASLVSRSWKMVINNQHIWRESFLREKTSTCATSEPVRPGTGLGVPRLKPGNDWKEIYRVREELDRNWKEGKTRAVYLNGHSDSIYCLQFDEDKIITGSRDKTIRIWDMRTYACKLVIGPPELVNSPTLLPLYDDECQPVHYATLPEVEQALADAGELRGPIRAHASTPALYCPPTHHKASILCLQYDDRILVTGSSDSTCIVYNMRSGYRPIRRLRHHTAAVLDLVFDEHHIVTCSKDISICVWDRNSGILIRQLRGHSGPVNAVQMRGNTIVSCSGDFRVKLWNIDTGKNIREFLGHSKGLACSQFSEDGRYVASAGNDRVIRIWDANTGECVREMKAHENLVRSLHVDSVSGRLVSGSYDTDIKVWDMDSGMLLLDFPKWHNSWVLSAKSDYRRIVSSGQDPKILVMDFGADIRGIEMLESRKTPTPLREENEVMQGEFI